jgi:hypothetical protein
MIAVKELKRWLETLPENGHVAVEDGGLDLVEVGQDGKPTEAMLAVGGIPLD